MSIASVTDRLRSARDAQAAALTAKGVDVPEGAGFEDFPALTEAIISGGGASAVYSGSFIPADNMLKATIDVGGEYSHFVLYSEKSVTGFGVKATAALNVDKNIPLLYGVATNNGGTSFSSLTSFSWNSNEGLPFFQVNNSQISVSNSRITISTTSPSGTCFGYFISGVKYNWFAW